MKLPFTLLISLGLFAQSSLQATKDDCKKGSFFVAVKKTCEKCPAGTFSGLDKAESCTPCGVGSWSATGAVSCTVAVAGTYEKDHKSVVACPKGTFNAFNGSTGAASCLKCAEGTISDAGAKICKVCPAGTFEKDRTECVACPKGTANALEAATGVASCKKCPEGAIANVAGAKHCSVCPSGKFEKDRVECVNCAAGTFSVLEASSNVANCLKCSAGTISTAGQSKCSPCKAGTYEDKRLTCVACPKDTYNTHQGVSGVNGCNKCADGSVSAPGSVKCTACHAGTYYEKKSGDCKPCPSGTFSTAIGAIGVETCKKCPTDSISEGNDRTKCKACPKGHHEFKGKCFGCPTGSFYNAKEKACKTCPAGQAYNRATGTCVNCPAGSYLDAATKSCKACPVNTINTLGGAASIEKCQKCPAGRVTEGKDRTNCVRCPIGTVEIKGACVACPEGTYNSVAGSAGADKCIKCSEGKVTEGADRSHCKPCPAGTFASKNTCALCPANTTSDAVGTSDPKTCLKCPQGFKTEGNNRVDCVSWVDVIAN